MGEVGSLKECDKGVENLLLTFFRAIVEGLVFHLQFLLQTICRLWNWDMYIRQ